MRTFLCSLAAAAMVLALMVHAQEPEAAKGKGGGGGKGAPKGGGGGGGKNLQVLSGDQVPAAMQTFVKGLGLLDKGTCAYCHVEDRSSDEKPQKVTARKMVSMVRELNARFQDGKPHITCYTCHRGSPTPEMAPQPNQ